MCCYYEPACTDSLACNFDPNACLDDGTCISLEFSNGNDTELGVIFDCDGICFNDLDSDGVCDELEITGCADVDACNYELLATCLLYTSPSPRDRG